MRTGFLILLILIPAGHALFSASVIYHLRKYTLPGWTAAKIVIPAYLFLSAVFFGLAVYFFLQIQM